MLQFALILIQAGYRVVVMKDRQGNEDIFAYASFTGKGQDPSMHHSRVKGRLLNDLAANYASHTHVDQHTLATSIEKKALITIEYSTDYSWQLFSM